MKIKILIPFIASSLLAATSSLAMVSMDFTNFNFTPIEQASDILSNPNAIIGSVYEATNVADLGGTTGLIDARFRFANASVNNSSLIGFVNETRGDDVRLRLNKTTSNSIWARVNISFFRAGTNTAVNVFSVTGDHMRVQFDDLDSDVGSNRSDFAGMLTSHIFGTPELASMTLLETATFTTPASSNFTIGRLAAGTYTAAGNITSTDPIDQSPVTIGFDTLASTISVIMGVTGPATGNRHIDLDMTPDFVIVPEPATYSFLVGLAVLGFVATRRRR